MAAYLRLHPTDNVVVAVGDLSPGDIVDDVKIIRRIPRGHKAAVRRDRQGHAGAEIRPDHRLRHPGHRARRLGA